ncbi:MAG: Hsp20/alpha crystallin family protein [Campylobacter sp.]|nr:Hsp20/alpha crystallin family protein [Campylobacter sp.]
MKLTTYDPFFSLKAFENDFFSPTFRNAYGFAPSVNTREDEKGFYVEVDLPGVKKDDIEIEVNNNVLTISGERKYQNETKKDDYSKVESFFGKFQRSFSLGNDIDAAKISAKQNDGILEIFIPKSAQKESKKISID